MKVKLFFFLLINSIVFFGQNQNEIYFFKDVNNSFDFETIQSIEFKKIEGTVVDNYSKSNFWFKIPKYNTDKKFVFTINAIYVDKASVDKKLNVELLTSQRFLSYRFDRSKDVYIKVTPFLKSYFPVKIYEENSYYLKENKALLYNGFYYGFSILVVLYSLGYYFSIRDSTYINYAFLLTAIILGFIILDGVFNLYNLKLKSILIINAINYIFLSYFSSKFIYSFLFLEGIYPVVKKLSNIFGALIGLLVFAYIITEIHLFYIIFGILAFLLFLKYWIICVTLFHKSFYVKVLIFAFSLLIFSVFDSFVLTNFGLSMLENNNSLMKLGGVIQIITLGFAVISREKILREENTKMKEEILKYSNLIKDKDAIEENNSIADYIKNLSIRERQIFDLILLGKSNKEIAFTVNISINTVKFHIKNIYEKLHIKSRKEAYNLSL